MKKVITIISIILSAILILDSMHFGHAVMMLLLAGQIPGTNVFISARVMLETCALLSGFVVGRLTNRLLQLVMSQLPVRRHA